MLKIDLHVHSEYSDGDSIDKILYYARLRKLNGLAIVDHLTVKGALKAAEASEDLIIIPGFEAETNIGHILVLGVREVFPKANNFILLYDWARDNDAVLILAHPLVTLPQTLLGINTLSRYRIDGVEAYNSATPLFRCSIKFSKWIANKLNLPLTGGSDAHYAENVGACYSLINASSSVDDILRSIKRGEVAPAGSSIRLMDKIKLITNILKK